MPTSYWFFWACWLPLMLAVAAADQQVEGCSGLRKRCGNLTISDPFWIIDAQKGRSCGSQDFEITCLNNIPLLPSTIPLSNGFEIISISYVENSLHVVDLDKMRLLPASNSRNERIWNISERLARWFRTDPINLNLIIYNCTNSSMARQDGELVETRMKCGSETSEFVRIGGRYHASENYEGYYMEGCISNSLPVLGTSGKANASDYEQLISDGFVLTWDPPPPGTAPEVPGLADASNCIISRSQDYEHEEEGNIEGPAGDYEIVYEEPDLSGGVEGVDYRIVYGVGDEEQGDEE